MGLFCDAGCTVVFSSTDVKVFDKHNNLILQGFRKLEGTRLWRFSLLPNQRSLTALKQLAFNATTSLQDKSHLIPCDTKTYPVQVTTINITTNSAESLTTKVPSTKPFKNSTKYHRRAYDLPSTKNLIEYLHCTVGSPVKDLSSARLKQATTVHYTALLLPTSRGIVLLMQRPQCSVTLHKFHMAYVARNGPLQCVLC